MIDRHIGVEGTKLSSMLKRRPKNILAVYVESRRLEIVRAQRQWRTWQLAPVEQYQLPEGEALYDFLQRMNLRPKGGHATALILFLPRSYYSFGREIYPLALKDRLEESLTFDWQENLFYEGEQTLRFAASEATGSQQLIVPIFSISQKTYDKFEQALGSAHFNSFTIVPSAMVYQSFIADSSQAKAQPVTRMIARVLGPSQMEVHRYFNGTIIDSFMVRKNHVTHQLFLETLRTLRADEETADSDGPRIDLICTPPEEAETATSFWVSDGLPITPCTIPGSVLTGWMEYLVNRDQLKAFGPDLRLKPWHPPRIILPLILLMALYGVFAAFEWHSFKGYTKTSNEVQTQRKQLEAQWKPIEQLQTNIARLKEQQKALAEFDEQSYPVQELFSLLTQITPEDTWLDFFSLTNKELQIRGESKSAAKYLSELNKVDGFSNVSFASPVSRNPTSDKERFNVRIQLEVDKLRRVLAARGSEVGVRPEEEGDSLAPALDTTPPQESAPAAEAPKSVSPTKEPDFIGKGRGMTPSKRSLTPPENDSDEDVADADGEEDEDSDDEAEEVTQ
jgi:Tfp pilus assembly protein PilN